MTPVKPNDHKQEGTQMPDRAATPSSESSSTDNDIEHEDHIRFSLEWLSLDPDCKRMLDDETKMLLLQKSKMGNEAVHIFQQAVHKDPEWFILAQGRNAAAMYAMRQAIVRFLAHLGITSYFARGQGNRQADMEGGRRQQVRKEWECWWFFL